MNGRRKITIPFFPRGLWNEEDGINGMLQIAAVLLLIFLAGMAVDFRQQSTDLASTARPLDDDTIHRRAIETVNRHLQDTDHQVEENSRAVEADNYQLAPPISPNDLAARDSRRADPDGLGLSFDHEDSAGRVLRDIEGRPSTAQYPVLPTDRINALQEQRKWIGEYDRQQKEAFIRAYIDNAAAAGYDVFINDQYQVVKVVKRNVQNPLRLPLSADPAPGAAAPSASR